MLSAGLPLPSEIIIHGFLTSDGIKISKSLGNSVDPLDVIAVHGSDAVRHFLLARVPIFVDSDFSRDRLARSYATDLANRLGNLYSRLRVLCEKAGFQGWIKSQVTLNDRVEPLLQSYALAEIADLAWAEIDRLNAEINGNRPWELLKAKESEHLHSLLSHWVRRLDQAATWLAPYVTKASQEIQNGLRGGQGGRILFPPRES